MRDVFIFSNKKCVSSSRGCTSGTSDVKGAELQRQRLLLKVLHASNQVQKLASHKAPR